MKKKKKTESIHKFMKRRNKITIPETKPQPSMAAGSHELLGRQMEIGVVKNKTRKELVRSMKKKKKKKIMEAVG